MVEKAKNPIKVNEETPVLPDRERRWKEHVENYRANNPVKWAAKNANHEFDQIPSSFK